MLHRILSWRSGRQWRLTRDIPDEPGQFPGNCDQQSGLRFTCPAQAAILFAKPSLRFPANIFDLLRQIRRALQIWMTRLWWLAIGLSSINQHGSRQCVTCLVQALPPDRAAAGVLAWHEPGLELARAFEPRDVIDLSYDG